MSCPAKVFFIDSLTGWESTLEFSADMQNVPFTETIQTNNADAPLGKATRGPIPLTLMLEATNIIVTSGTSLNLNITLHLPPAAI